ncbi:leucine rich repeat protein [Aspergillus flavus]|nr:leucine rich repeat protein [Aspergillus flavus]
MGKLNYSARKIDGEKFARVLSRDLRKRLPDGPGFKAAARDPTLEIDIANKTLTDQDLSIFIDDLLECIREDLAKVVEFHIQGNSLTIKSLPKLGEAIALNAGEMRELDISNNNINISPSPEDKAMWCQFLNSFKNCYMLKKLDLGGNPLGPVGLEVLARVYIKSDLHFLEDDAYAIVEPKHEERSFNEDSTAVKVTAGKENERSTRGSRLGKSPNKGKKALRQNFGQFKSNPAKGTALDDLKRFACTRGLRSIAYLILSNVYMAKSGTVHLASMLSMQRTSDQLLKFLPGGKSPALPETANSKSIIWLPNDTLPQVASEFLGKAEAINEIKTNIDSDDDLSNDDEAQGPVSTIAQTNAEPNQKIDTAAQRELQNKKNTAYARLTKRVRMEALHDEGVHGTDLWITALRMMNVSRILLWQGKESSVCSPNKEQGQQEDDDRDDPYPSAVHIEDITQQFDDLETAEHPSSSESPSSPVEIHITEPDRMGPFHPGTDSFDANFPILHPSNTENADTSLTRNDEEQHIVAARNELSASPQPARSGKGNSRTTYGSRALRKEKETWRFGFTLEIWRRIIADAAGAEGILDLEQQTQIMRYATDSKTLEDEMGITGLEDHQQIWRILEKNNCFVYSPL